jgi:LPPG:FO 2-phospho-L-lactate transferase
MLAGGIGASRLAVPMAAALGAERLTLVVNTADDVWLHGLRICPDLDTNLYALAGLRDAGRGWGVADDSFRAMGQLRRLGGDPWFALGDVDLAMHLRRTGRLREGAALSEATAEVAAHLGVMVRLLPMTDAEVATVVETDAGPLGFQEWFVARRAEDAVRSVTRHGIEAARPAPGVLEAIAAADLVVVGPSNPVASIEPILALPGVREAVASRPALAVTPVVSGVPITDEGEARRARSRAALLAARGLEHTATAVASCYRNLVSTFVLDDHDAAEAAAIEALGLTVVVTSTLIADGAAGDRLATTLLGLHPLHPLGRRGWTRTDAPGKSQYC